MAVFWGQVGRNKKQTIMKARIIFAVAAMAAVMSSCSVFHYSEARLVDATPSMVVVPPSAKVQVNPTAVQEVWTYEGLDLKAFKNLPNMTDRLKVAATFKTLQKHGGDVLVAPLYDVRSENGNTRYIVTVRGYIGTYVDWDKNGVETPVVVPENMKVLNVKTYDSEDVKVVNPIIVPNCK